MLLPADLASMRLTHKQEGFSLALKVVPGASRERIVGPYGDALKLTVTAAPEAGAANEAVIALLAETLGVPRANIRLTHGHTRPQKEVLILGLTAEQITQRLLSAK